MYPRYETLSIVFPNLSSNSVAIQMVGILKVRAGKDPGSVPDEEVLESFHVNAICPSILESLTIGPEDSWRRVRSC